MTQLAANIVAILRRRTRRVFFIGEKKEKGCATEADRHRFPAGERITDEGSKGVEGDWTLQDDDGYRNADFRKHGQHGNGAGATFRHRGAITSRHVFGVPKTPR